MKTLSISVGLPREVTWKGRTVSTSIFKEPVSGPVLLRRHNLEGDGQADLSVHGGPTKAVYAYPSEHYPFWRSEFPEMELQWGMFGENLTTEGLAEESVHIGDVFQLGTAQLVVTEPRMPCFKLTIRFERDDIVKRFLQSQRSGLYFGVMQEGTVQAGDRFELVSTDSQRLKVADVTRLYTTDKGNAELLAKAVETSTLPEKWRDYFDHRLEKIMANK
ncbi:MAG: MOSC domain-containing protein [Proteobacteria bacterium]|nr:MOSC domain-containing protein [Pseudomonadota bacterium]